MRKFTLTSEPPKDQTTNLGTYLGRLIGLLLIVVDAWYETYKNDLAQLASAASLPTPHSASGVPPPLTAPKRVAKTTDRLEVIGLLTYLIAKRFHGFKYIPTIEDITPFINDGLIGLRIRSPKPVAKWSENLIEPLEHYGFSLETVKNTKGLEIIVKYKASPTKQATILPFNKAKT